VFHATALGLERLVECEECMRAVTDVNMTDILPIIQSTGRDQGVTNRLVRISDHLKIYRGYGMNCIFFWPAPEDL
jgi:hypothetical protein